MVLIVGGGSAGFYYAALHKENNPAEQVILVEEHSSPGKPVQCTGILTKEIENLIPKKELKKFVINKISRTEVFSKNRSVIIPLETNYIIDNVGFIMYLAARAKNAGVKIYTGHKYIENIDGEIKILNIATKKTFKIKDDKIVGADGPLSVVAKKNNFFGKRKFLTGVQVRMKLKIKDEHKIDFYPSIGAYAWFVPEGKNVARIGLAFNPKIHNGKILFEQFVAKYKSREGKILETQGGIIPLYSPGIKTRKKTENSITGNTIITLIGDAASQIKNTTGGGIIPGLKAARILAENFDAYEKKTSCLRRELFAHYLLRNALEKFSDNDWDRLLKKIDNKKTKDVLMKTNRDNGLELLLKLCISKPSLAFEGIMLASKTLN